MAGTRRKGKDPLPALSAPGGAGTATLAPQVEPTSATSKASPQTRPPHIRPSQTRLTQTRLTQTRLTQLRLPWPPTARFVAIGVVVALLVGLGAYALIQRAGGAATTAADPRRVVLLTIDGAENASLGGVLLASGGQGTPGGVLIPPRLLVDVAGFGSVTFAEAGRAPQSGAQAAALSDALGITVAGTWRLNADAVARLIDTAGGIELTLDAELFGVDAKGRSILLFPAGTQRLDGATVITYLQPLSVAEPEESVAARLQQVVAGLLATLPADQALIAETATSLGAGSRTDLAPEDLAETVAAVRNAESPLYLTIPLRPLDSGGEAPSYTLADAAAGDVTRGILAEAALPVSATGEVRVLVRNGVGTPGLGQSARQRLVDAGLAYLNGGNAGQFGTGTSVVLIADASTASRQEGAAVATALGLPGSAVQISGQGQHLADVVVILGADFVD